VLPFLGACVTRVCYCFREGGALYKGFSTSYAGDRYPHLVRKFPFFLITVQLLLRQCICLFVGRDSLSLAVIDDLRGDNLIRRHFELACQKVCGQPSG
jgi:hypothetical protein